MQVKLRNMASIYLKKDDQLLLLYRQGGRVVNDMWIAAAGGHFEPSELNSPEECVIRELKEELSLSKNDISHLTLRYIALRNVNNEIRQNYFYFADLNDIDEFLFKSNEGKLQWFDINELPLEEMPLTAKFVLEHYLKNIDNSDYIYGGIVNDDNIQFYRMN